MKTGLCSVTFRGLDVPQVAQLASQAGLQAIEWGGDIHVPPGDERRASFARDTCDERGLKCPSYGSYFVLGETDERQIAPTLATAKALGADVIRVWAGPKGKGSTAYNDDDFERLAQATRRFAQAAGDSGLVVATEFHRGRFADNSDAVLKLIDRVRHPALRTYWQWECAIPVGQAKAQIAALRPHIAHLHVFNWTADGTRLPLSDARSDWLALLSELGEGKDGMTAYLEFIPQDDQDQLDEETKTLAAIAMSSSDQYALRNQQK
ncbi:MAG: sugar phosphate isomerase/epimerase [Pseudomonadota bacterium]